MEENNNNIISNKDENSNSKLSYSQNFWQNFPKLNEHIKYRENELSNLIFFYSKLSSIYKDFSIRLSELLNINFNFDKKFEIGKKLEILLNQTKTECENYKILSEKINNEIIQNLEFSNNTIFSNNKNFINLRYFLSKKFEFYLNNVKLSRKDYHTNVGECVQNNLEFEVLKKNNVPKEKKVYTSIQNNLKNSINQANESRLIYKNNINQCNDFRKQFIAKHIEIYNKLETNEKILIQLEIDSIKKYNSILKEHYEKIQKNNLNTENNLNNFDCNNDINLFINQNKNLGNGPFEIKYCEYSNQNPIDLNDFQKDHQIKIGKKEQIEEIKKFLNSHFNYSLINDNKDLKEIQEKCVKIWENKMDKNEDKNLISIFLQNNKFNFDKINIFLNYFNNIRKEGKYDLEENSYEIISNIMNDLINFNYDDTKNDFDTNTKYIEMMSLIIILSQTYYKKDKISNTEIYLQKKIQNSNLFKNVNFWNKLTKYYIHCDLQGNNYTIDFNEKNIKNIDKVFDIKISTTIFILSSFDLDKNIIIKIIEDFAKSFNLNKENLLIQYNANKNENNKNKTQNNSKLINLSIEENNKIDDNNNEQNNEIIKKNEDLVLDFENIEKESKNSENDPKNKKEGKKFSTKE